MSLIFSAFISISVCFLFVSGYYIFRWQREVRFLKKTLNGIIGKRFIETHDDLVKIKNFLTQNIRFDVEKREAKRPFLRETAMNILKSGYGFCGENARVAILLLKLGKIQANRLYVFGEQWNHVAVELKWEGSFYLFDGHHDPKTILPDEQVLAIRSDILSEFPNKHLENKYIDVCRIGPFRNHLFLDKYKQIRIPSFLVLITESPSLIKAIIYLFLSLAVFALSQ